MNTTHPAITQTAAIAAPHTTRTTIDIIPVPHPGTFGRCEVTGEFATHNIIWTVWENAAESTDHERLVSTDALPQVLAQAVQEANGILWNYNDTITIEVAIPANTTAATLERAA